MYSFKVKHSNSSRIITAIFFKLTTEKLTKFRNLTPRDCFISNYRYNLYYCLTPQEVELLCLSSVIMLRTEQKGSEPPELFCV